MEPRNNAAAVDHTDMTRPAGISPAQGFARMFFTCRHPGADPASRKLPAFVELVSRALKHSQVGLAVICPCRLPLPGGLAFGNRLFSILLLCRPKRCAIVSIAIAWPNQLIN